MGPISVELGRPHRLGRWVLPLGFFGLVAITGIMLLLPRDSAGTFFWIARLVFVVAYLGLVGIGLSRVRRTASITVDASGVHEAGALIVPRDRIERALLSRAAGITTLELRGRRVSHTTWIVLSDDDLAHRMLAVLDPHAGGATVSYLATTTPIALVVFAWMGLPMLYSIPAQMMMHAPLAVIVAAAIPAVLLWLFASYWFMRRRRVTVSPTELGWPLLLGGETHISLAEVTGIARPDAFTVRVEFSSRSAKKLKIYDPGLVEDFVARVSAGSGQRPR